MPREWEITKSDGGRHDFKVICESHISGFSLSCQYKDRPGVTLEVQSQEEAKAVIEAWDGRGSMLDAFSTQPTPVPVPGEEDVDHRHYFRTDGTCRCGALENG